MKKLILGLLFISGCGQAPCQNVEYTAGPCGYVFAHNTVTGNYYTTSPMNKQIACTIRILKDGLYSSEDGTCFFTVSNGEISEPRIKL
jgi:hypothetical protein